MTKKEKYSIEYKVKCSPKLLYQFVSQATHLQEWFADDVVAAKRQFTFYWDRDEPKVALLLESQLDVFAKFKWEDAAAGEYFEFRIFRTEISRQTILTITDFAFKNEIKDQTMLWDYQVNKLRYVLGN